MLTNCFAGVLSRPSCAPTEPRRLSCAPTMDFPRRSVGPSTVFRPQTPICAVTAFSPPERDVRCVPSVICASPRLDGLRFQVTRWLQDVASSSVVPLDDGSVEEGQGQKGSQLQRCLTRNSSHQATSELTRFTRGKNRELKVSRDRVLEREVRCPAQLFPRFSGWGWGVRGFRAVWGCCACACGR